jgi:hypothetical protein
VIGRSLARRARARLGTLAAALLVPIACPSLHAQGGQVDGERGSELRVYLVTMGPGSAIWERFGHNAIRVVDSIRGVDVVFNYGMFAFDQPDFLSRFLLGDTKYWMEAHDTQQELAAYRRANRTVWQQELELAPPQKAEMVRFLAWNAREENKYYRYDYYLDNCSTRVRDAIDRVIGGALGDATKDSVAVGTSFRWHTRRLLGPDVPAYAGIQVALGRPADRPITRWEEAFLPVRLMEEIRTVRVRGLDGASRPLVKTEEVLSRSTRPDEPSSPPDRTIPNLLAGVVLGAVLVAAGVAARRGAGAMRALFSTAAVLWSLVAGLVGVVLVLAWTATRHEFWYRNENLLQLNPLSLLLVALVPLVFLRGRAHAAARASALVVLALSVIGLLLALVPGGQASGEVVALALPVHAALAWVLARRHA